MSDTKHTPGDWSYSGVTGDYCIMARRDGHRVVIATVSEPIRGDLVEECDANLVLIATAPKLLDFARTVAMGNSEFETLERLARELIEEATL